MKRKLGGFTIIEVTLFLAITGLLFLGVTMGVQSSVYNQRFNDSVQSFVEFLRNIYAETMNVQNADSGRSGQAIYGKLVTFGETTGLESSARIDGRTAFVYDIVGKVNGDVGSGNILTALNGVEADVVIREGGTTKLAGIVESYTPRWQAEAQQACTSSTCYAPIKAAILVVRHPRSGTVYTFVMKNNTIEINNKVQTTNNAILGSFLNGTNFKNEAIDFCINPEGSKAYNRRANVRINKDARNSSAVQIINDEGDNKCR
ncbi:hypothetical protein J6X04_03275 [Candidatus Saccharibacteria bacterium]|nr:hypothetical protein [Candidatus Saccharibacteria bacterium]